MKPANRIPPGLCILAMTLLAMVATGCKCVQHCSSEPNLAVVKLEPPPRFLYTRLGGPVTLTAEAKVQEPTYQWFRDCDAVPRATERTLTIPAVTRADLGQYTCVVQGQSRGMPFGPAFTERLNLLGYEKTTAPVLLPGKLPDGTQAITNLVVIVVPGQPTAGAGSTTCCGAYVGRVVYAKGAWPNWGWSQISGQPVYRACACDPTACVVFTSSTGRTGCGTGCVDVPYIAGAQFRFGVYFKSAPVPSTCNLTLYGFNP